MFITRNKEKSKSSNSTSTSSSHKNAASSSSSSSSSLSKKKATSSSSSPPATVSIQGINVHFPFTPYPNQKTYMETVMKALHSSENALLESPTGTGKTLCLLCSTLAWQLEQRSNALGLGGDETTENTSNQRKVPIIIYASRTHSQLSQVVKEMRYRPSHAVLGSREQMCIHPKVNPSKSSSSKKSSSSSSSKRNSLNTTNHDINMACTKLNKERKCRFRNNLEGFIHTTDSTTSSSKSTTLSENTIQQPVLDIEELVTMGQKKSICPFYFTRNQISNADIIFIPYNYLFDTETRKNTLNEIEFENSIIIFDEAHNLESFASDSASFDLTAVDIGGCIIEVQRCIGYMQNMPELMDNGKDNSSNSKGGGSGSRLTMDNLLKLKSIFLQLENYVDCKVPPNGGSFSGEYIFEILKQGANITFQTHMVFLRFVRQVSECIMDMRGDSGSGVGGRNTTSSGTPKLDHFVSCMRKVFGSTEIISMARARSYRVHISPKFNQGNSSGGGGGGGFLSGKTHNGNGDNNQGRKLSYWCFAPALAMNELAALKVRSILVTSGTLSPLPSYSLELGIPFPHMLENSHIIEKEQIAVQVVGTGVSGKALNSSFKRRDDSEYITELGNTIISLVRVIPGGVLIFFPSYSVMEKCIEHWGGPASSKSKARNYATKSNFFQARRRSKNQGGTGIGRYCFPQDVFSGKNPSQWQRLLSLKAVILEPQSTSELKEVIDEFDKYISMPKSTGCIMMGVCRGKISEGIDFADEKCRAVIITGIPFAPYLDPKVKLKREYLDGIRLSMATKASGDGGFNSYKGNNSTTTNITLSGAEWYSQQAHRAVNQAIGRVIRHRFDYGSILFLDSRYSEAKNQNGTSKWIRPCFEPDKGIGPVIGSLVRFYRSAKMIVDERKRAIKDAAPKPAISLRYEEEPSQVNSIKSEDALGDCVTKVSFIKKDADKVDVENNGYIPPDQVIQNVELNDHKGGYVHTKHDNRSSLSKNNIARKRVELQKKLSKTVVEQEAKQSGAKRFYKLAQNCLSPTDFKAMGKVLVSMKSHGESKDSDSYLFEARKLLNILLLYDHCRFRSNTEKKSDLLVEYLLPLLPAIYRHSIEKIACEIRYNNSIFREECTKVLGESDCVEIDVKTPSLMLNFNNRAVDASNQRRNRNSNLGNYHAVVRLLMEKKQESLLRYLYPLIPKDQIKTVRVLVKDYKATQTIKAMKEHDSKRYGEGSIKTVLFQKSSKKNIVLEKKIAHPENVENEFEKRQALHAAGRIIKEKKGMQQELWAASRNKLREENKKRKMTSTSSSKVAKGSNQASKLSVFDKMAARPPKKVKATEKDNTGTYMVRSTSPKNRVDDLETCLKVASTERFQASKSSNKGMNNIRSNAPIGTTCTICNIQATDLYLSPCNHVACSNCWGKWLKRSDTCPSCRKPVKKSELSKVVYHKESEKLPSFTQMCEVSSDEDEELEIIK